MDAVKLTEDRLDKVVEKLNKVVADHEAELQHHSKLIQQDAYLVAEIVTEELIETLLPLLLVTVELYIYYLRQDGVGFAFSKTYMTAKSVENNNLIDVDQFWGASI